MPEKKKMKPKVDPVEKDRKEYERTVRQLQSTVDRLEVDVKVIKTRMGL